MNLTEIIRGRISPIEERYNELQKAVSDPEVASTPGYPAMLRELGSLEKTLAPWREYEAVLAELTEAREMVAGEDEEMAALAEEEIPALEKKFSALEEGILDRALEDDRDGDRPAIVEIRAGAGGDEAAIFAGDLFEIYNRYSQLHKWKVEVLDSSASDMGGFKEISFKITGDEVFRLMRFESGGHRVQRVPKTETQGRIHTSAATVAVLPEVEAMDFELKPEDLEFQAMRSSGPGGQHVNKTSSAVRVIHKPTGEQVKCQESKQQGQNREMALALLRSRLYEREKAKRDAERAEERKGQIGSGDRSQRVRTYNWPQNRVTDHRIGSNFSLEQVLEGQLDSIVEGLLEADRAAKLAAL
ncbi:MAG TPA: peptide chain release factor 1 [Planctomycetota bacterium]|jgi:peptide chain release factor 1|nr:peptide chain release factor 1 [Planctomycetota bacterium]MDP7246367.1 peptide chain release factor 1 [Planctomycetota bacterium]HJM39129.1 peptide chain release factor 1 [Planctomycetota bacterium]|tara:strand:- start:132 stop:1205 length:1074 start_codon:yes stop_codon:yes gene_type:complete